MSEDKKKFLFHLHNFGEQEEDNGPPPPPLFTEDELARAKDKAYKQGKQDGFQESQASIEKKISVLLQNAQQVFLDLQSQELSREKRYEQEAVHLALTLFKSIYPAWIAERGQKDVIAAIEHVLKSAANQQTIQIDVNSALLSSIEERLAPLLKTLVTTNVSFQGNDDLSEGDMRMNWGNGGAVRDTKILSEQILQILQDGLPEPDETGEVLAALPETRHNEIENTEKPDER